MKARKLTDDEKLNFIREYIANGHNGRAAYQAIRPESKNESARVASNRLLHDANVALTLERMEKEAYNRAAQAVADQRVEAAKVDANADDYVATLVSEAVDTIRKIHTGEICDESRELDENGEWKVTKMTSRAADRQRAAEKIIEMYGGTTDNAIRVELIGGAEDLSG